MCTIFHEKRHNIFTENLKELENSMKSQNLGNQLDDDDFRNIEELLNFVGNESNSFNL